MSGAIITAMAAGGFAGCLLTGPLLRRVGHARVFAVMAALINIGTLLIALGTIPSLWIVARCLYGLAAAGLFIVTQSWLNDACDNAWRGKIIATFYMIYVTAIGAGSYLLTFVSLDGPQAPLVAVFFGCLAILPVGLTRLRTPPPPDSITIAVRSVWRISPVGLVGCLAVGGLTMLVQGFAPIYAATENYSKDEIALLMFLMQLGMIGVQYPLGAVSDRTDRRFVLVAACGIVIVTAGLATQLSGMALFWMILVFALWSGATESIFSVANAHANDRAEPQYYVSLSSTLLIAWSVSGLVIPALATALTGPLGARAFMFVAIVIAVLYGLFVLYRLTRREPVPVTDQGPYQQVSAQVPLTPELAPHTDDRTPGRLGQSS